MFSAKKKLILSGLIASALIFSSCGPEKVFIDLTQQKEIALIGFNLDKSISMVNHEEREAGPGLLQKAVMGKDEAEADYFEDHNKALNELWSVFQTEIQDALLGIPMVSLDKIVNNEEILAITETKRKVVLGTDMTLAGNYLCPEGLNFISNTETEKLDKVCEKLGVNLLLIIDNKIQYEEVKSLVSVGVNSITINTDIKAHVLLTTTVKIYEKGKGTVAIEPFKAKSDDEMLVVAKIHNSKNYAPLAKQACVKMPAQIKERFLMHKQKVAEKAALQGK